MDRERGRRGGDIPGRTSAAELGGPQGSRAYPFETSRQIDEFTQTYRRSKAPIDVSFRDIVPWLKLGERATHYLHPYPAKLLPHIAHFFLASQNLCPQGGLVLDPFGGSGTVALETCLSGRRASYADTNPLARLITEAKLSIASTPSLKGAFGRVAADFARSRTGAHPAVVNIEKWFEPQVIRALSRLKAAIEQETEPALQRVLLATFSATVRRVSNADPRLSVPVLLKGERATRSSREVWTKFTEQFESNIRRIENFSRLCPSQPTFSFAGNDARHLTLDAGGLLAPASVDLVITSPPYAGAQKYIRASSLSLGWLGIAEEGQLKPLENATIGREHLPGKGAGLPLKTSVPAANIAISRIQKKNQVRAAICATYLNEMEVVIQQVEVVMRPGARLVLVIGNNEVCGEQFMSSEYLRHIAERVGLRLEYALIDEIKSRGLMTKRNKTASVITREWVLVFRK